MLCCAQSLQLCLTVCDAVDCNSQALSMGFSRQEYWSGLPCPPTGDLPDLRDRTWVSYIAGRFFITEPPGKPTKIYMPF